LATSDFSGGWHDHLARKEDADRLGDFGAVPRGGEVAEVEQVQLGVGQLVEIRPCSPGGKNASFRPLVSSAGGV
jgi:hypothetical protein